MRRKLWRFWERGARHVVRDPDVWTAIELLAPELLERETLSGARAVRALVEPILGTDVGTE